MSTIFSGKQWQNVFAVGIADLSLKVIMKAQHENAMQ